MVATLIKKILLQADLSDAKLEQMSDLNTHLKSACSRRLRHWFAVNGGLGSTYKAIEPFLTVNSDGIITAINQQEIIELGRRLLDDSLQELVDDNVKSAYKAGICFALVAVYANDISTKLVAYQALSDLYIEDGILSNPEMYGRCLEFLTPNLLDNQFYPLNKIIWTWEIKGKQDVLLFETQRHAVLLGNDPNPQISIEKALLLLGLKNDSLDVSKITSANALCRAKLKSLAGLTAQQVRSNPIFNHYKEAENILLHYMKFRNFNYQTKFQPLTVQLARLQTADITDEVIFNDMYRLFNGIEGELKQVIKIFVLEPKPSTYISTNYFMIRTQLGGNGWSGKYIAEEQLKIQAERYWQVILNKIDPLIAHANVLLSDSRIAGQSSNDIKEHCTKIEKALEVLTQIIGSPVEETSLILSVATDAEVTKNTLSNQLEQLKKKVAQYEEKVKSTANNIFLFHQELSKTAVHSPDVIGIDFFREERAKIEKIDKNLIWLRSLGLDARLIVSNEFSTHILSQASIGEVVNAVTAELNKIDKPVRDKALNAILGSKYNKTASLELTIKGYFEPRKDQDLDILVTSFLGEIRGLIKEEQNLAVDINVKDVIPKPSYMTFDLAVQDLEENKARINLAVNKAYEELHRRIQSLTQIYSALMPEIDLILQDKNSLKFAWQDNMANFLQKQQKVNEEMNSFHKIIPADFKTADYMDSSFVSLINQLHQQKSKFDKKASAMKNQIGKASLDVLNYALLKNYIKQEKKAYIAQGNHHQARMDSLERLSYAIEGIDNNNGGNRFALLVAEVTKERDKTAISHQSIRFLGHYRSSRLEKMYTTIIDASKNLAAFFPSKHSWDNAALSLDTLKYMKLKDQITKERLSYIHYGIHHKDRYDSLNRLRQLIDTLDTSDNKQDNRFASLFEALQQEQITTIQSHHAIGFFAKWHSCRLQRVYGKILLEYSRFNELSIAPTEELPKQPVSLES